MKTINLKEKPLTDIARNMASVLGVPKYRTTDDRKGFIIERGGPQCDYYHLTIIKKLVDLKNRSVSFSLQLEEGVLSTQKADSSIKIQSISDFSVSFPNVMAGEERRLQFDIVDGQGATRQFEIRKGSLKTHRPRMDSGGPAREIRQYKKGARLFDEGDTGEEMFILQKGTVGLYKHADSGDVLLAKLGPGNFFGEMALIGNPNRSATAVAETPVQVIVISKEIFEYQLAQIPSWFVTMFKTIVSRLADTNTMVNKLKDRLAAYETVEEPTTPPAMKDEAVIIVDESEEDAGSIATEAAPLVANEIEEMGESLGIEDESRQSSPESHPS